MHGPWLTLGSDFRGVAHRLIVRVTRLKTGFIVHAHSFEGDGSPSGSTPIEVQTDAPLAHRSHVAPM